MPGYVKPKHNPIVAVMGVDDPMLLNNTPHVLIAVPTLIKTSGEVETKHLQSAIDTVAKHCCDGTTVVVESSVAVGMTRSLLKHLATTRAFKGGMSPERVDPGRLVPSFQNISKIISDLDDMAPGSLQSINALYSPVFSNLFEVSSPEIAEMTKLYENCQRLVCIAYANEMADACVALGLDHREVTRAAATKPFGYLPISASVGVGGHCIPVNLYYLFTTSNLPYYSKPSRRQKDARNTSATNALLEHLQTKWNVHAEFADPMASQEQLPHIVKFDETRRWHQIGLSFFDLIVVAIRHDGLDFECLKRLKRTRVEMWCA